MADDKAILIRFTPEEHEALRAYSSVVDLSMTEVVRRAVREYLAGDERAKEIRAVTESLPKQLRRLS